MRDVLYMAGIVAVGFAVNFLLRALPFVLFGSRRRPLPAWAAKASDCVSPVIIAGLIVYAYSGMAWSTVWPYLAGALTVGLQLWRRNPLASIVAGTVLYMLLINCGCMSTRQELLYDDDHPLIRVTNDGVMFKEKFVTPQEVPALLKKNRIPKDATIHILVDEDFHDQKALWVFRQNYINRAGYTRAVWVNERRYQHASPYEVEKLGVERLDRNLRQETTPYEGRSKNVRR